jgi:hypothetical protein
MGQTEGGRECVVAALGVKPQRGVPSSLVQHVVASR